MQQHRLIIAVVLLTVGIGAVFSVYLGLLRWITSRINARSQEPEKGQPGGGLSKSELKMLPRTKNALKGAECAVCLEVILIGQTARIIPECNHTFHLHCADKWLSKNPVCPLCRAKIIPVPR